MAPNAANTNALLRNLEALRVTIKKTLGQKNATRRRMREKLQDALSLIESGPKPEPSPTGLFGNANSNLGNIPKNTENTIRNIQTRGAVKTSQKALQPEYNKLKEWSKNLKLKSEWNKIRAKENE